MSDDPIETRREVRGVAWLVEGWVRVAAPYIASVAIWFGLSRWFPRFNPFVLVMWLPAMVVGSVFTYRHYFRPERVPAMLSEDSGELARLLRRKETLAKIEFVCVGAMFTILVMGAAIGSWKTTIDRTAYLLALPALGYLVCFCWREALVRYIEERKPIPLKRGGGDFRTRPLPVGKPFHSEHWGEPPQRL